MELEREKQHDDNLEAYRYKDDIVVFGWSGNYVGVVTIIDASTGREMLQLLVKEQNRLITQSGELVYDHWLVKGAYEPGDSVWLLNLNNPLPAPELELSPGVVVEIGRKIYPGASDNTMVRHSIRDLLTSANGRELFFADWPINKSGSGGAVCFVRIDLAGVRSPESKRNCAEETALRGRPTEDFQSSKLELDRDGVLRFSLMSLREPAAGKHFVVDPMTLVPSESTVKSPEGNAGEEAVDSVQIPWEVQKVNLVRGSAIDLGQSVFAGHEQDHVEADLLISEDGSVLKVRLTGSTAEVRRQIEAALRTWGFLPTRLNGHATKVRVQIESSPERLSTKS